MWSENEARKLITKARETDSVLAHELADYLGYAMGTIEYYKDCFKEAEKGEE